MLLHLHDEGLPQASEVADIFDSYADLIDGALDELPQRIGCTTYLPTLRVRRRCAQAVHQLRTACSCLDGCGKLIGILHEPDQRRPIDLVGLAIKEVASARNEVVKHQSDARSPASNRLMLQILADTMRLADEDLRGMLGPVVARLSPIG